MSNTPHAPRRWIINADDFGFSQGVTDGILRAYREGILTSTTLMATMPDCERAIALAAECGPALGKSKLGVGMHLCLTQGKPLTKCTTLLDYNGQFPRSLGKLFVRLGGINAKRARREALDEWCAQVKFAESRGIKITHLDSHKHIHHFPALQEVVIEVARRFSIRHIRCAREIRIQQTARPSIGYKVLATLAGMLAGKLPAPITTTDWFFGLATTDRTDDAVWEKLVAHAPPGIGEIMVHPGYITDITANDTRLLQGRVVEMEALLSPRVRDAITRKGIKLVNFGEL